MDNWNFTGKPDVPAWPKDPQGQDEKGRAADADLRLSRRHGHDHLPAGGLRHPLLQVLRSGRRRGKVINGFSGYGASLYVPEAQLEEARTCWPPSRWRTRKRKNTPERSFLNMLDYKREYERWLASDALNADEKAELQAIAGDEKGDREPVLRPTGIRYRRTAGHHEGGSAPDERTRHSAGPHRALPTLSPPRAMRPNKKAWPSAWTAA